MTAMGNRAGDAATKDSPASSGFRMPAEWEPHRAIWTAWPAAADLWGDALPAAQAEFGAMCRAIAGGDGAAGPDVETLEVLVATPQAEQAARRELAGLPVRFHPIPYGDIWLRDTAPLFVRRQDGEVAAVCFRFNGWGEKYLFAEDLALARALRRASGVHAFDVPMVLEGGAVEVDGEGTVLTTRQCLLHPSRNPSMGQAEIETHLLDALGATNVCWLDRGLANDHTDGHVDTLARFVAPGRVLCMEARDAGDPNREALDRVRRDLESMIDARGRRLDVSLIPSPGRIDDGDGRPMPASYVNFLVANRAVVVPTYGSPFDEEAVEAVARCFPGRRTVGVSARAILGGGGAFHCITQQEPRGATP